MLPCMLRRRRRSHCLPQADNKQSTEKEKTMSRTRSWQLLFTLLSIVGLLVAGSSGAALARAPHSHTNAGKTLVLNVSTGQDTLDPSATVQLGPASNIAALYGRLTQLAIAPGPQGTFVANANKVKPWLAQSW